DEHGNRLRAGTRGDGRGDAAGRQSRPAGGQVGPDGQEALRHGVLAPRGRARLDELRLCLVTDRNQTRGRDLVEIVAACVTAGLPAVQVREKDLAAGELATL